MFQNSIQMRELENRINVKCYKQKKEKKNLKNSCKINDDHCLILQGKNSESKTRKKKFCFFFQFSFSKI